MSTIAETATIRGGYSMAELDRLAKVACRRTASGFAGDQDDRYEAAWFAIVEALYTTDAPTERDLLFAGIQGVQRAVAELNQSQGRSHRNGYEFGSAPRFATYWNEQQSTPSHETPIIETVALGQVLAVLSPEQYEALAAVAVCETLTDAAAALGLTYAALIRRYYSARAAARAAWFEGQQDPALRVITDTCKSNHPRADHWRTGPGGHGYCAECQRFAKKRRRARGAAA